MPWEGVKIPEDPKNYDPEHKYADPVAYFQHREAATAEEFIKVAEAKVRLSQLPRPASGLVMSLMGCS
jgi:hypothetical protein